MVIRSHDLALRVARRPPNTRARHRVLGTRAPPPDAVESGTLATPPSFRALMFPPRTQIDSGSTMCRVRLSTTQTAFPNVCDNLPSSLLGSDSVFQVTLTPSRPLPYASRPHANLVSLHLAYIWKTVARRSDTVNSGHMVEEASPFSPTLFLPATALLNRATELFLIYHFVGYVVT